MKKILLMFVVLITSISNAQNTFTFRCIPAEELAIAAIYEANTPPTGFSDALSDASVIANQNATNPPFQKSRKDFVSLFDNYELTFNNFITEDGKIVADYDNNNFSNIPLPGGDNTINDNAEWNEWMLDIAQAIWHYGHPDYDPDAVAFANELTAFYGGEHPPTEFISGSIIDAQAQAVALSGIDRSNFVKRLSSSNHGFLPHLQTVYDNNGLATANIYRTSDNIKIGSVSADSGTIGAMSEQAFSNFVLKIITKIWNIEHPNYDPLSDELTAIYEAAAPPTELGPEAIAAATAAYNVDTNAAITNFIFDLDDKSTSGVSVVNSSNAATYVVLDNNDQSIEANRTYSPNKVLMVVGTNNDIELGEYKGLVFNVVEALYYAQHPEVVAAELRAERIADLDALDKDGVNVTDSANPNRGDVFIVSYGTEDHYFYADQYGPGLVENQDVTQYGNYKNAIIAKRDEIIVANTPTVAKELDAFATGDKPTGSAPEWLPTALYASANTNTNGTKRTAFLVSLSGHGVNITHILNDGSATTHFRVSTGDGYDYIISWAPYGPNGWNQMTAESFRRLAFDVIVLKWKKIHETHNTERSDILDQNLDTTDVDVILVTYADDWWIYFNNTGVPILSGGRPLDPMFHNKFTLNPHDTYMTESEFQKLVVFVTYMRDNYTRLKAINGTYNRKIEIENLVDEYGAVIANIVDNFDGSTHYTFRNNGNSNEYPVQSNWTHAAGTTLGQLNADSWVKFYAKCRGIILGL